MVIETLVQDIERVLVEGIDATDQEIESFGVSLGAVIASRLKRGLREPTLRMSNMGKPCKRQLWYEINEAEEAEPLRAEHYLKFLYGDIIEELLLFLVVQAGHSVRGRQDELEIEGIKGHIDAIVDNVVIDVKSASSPSFKKFREGLTPETDAFGYLGQLGSYVYAYRDDPTVQRNIGAFLAVDKTLGHIHLDIHEFPDRDVANEYRETKALVAREEPPSRGYAPEPFGKSGNEALGINCSYCPWKTSCWPEVRTFLYANRPIHLVKVVMEPKVPELLKESYGETEDI